MWKKTISVTVFVLALMLILAGCFFSKNDETEKPEVEARVISISVDASSIPSSAYVGEFDASMLRLYVTYSDNEVKTIGANINMVSTASRQKLQQVGTQMIELVYSNCSTKFPLTIIEKPKKEYTLRIYGGVPIEINGAPVLDKIEVEGDYFEEVYKEDTVLKIEWTPVEGYSFLEWTDSSNINWRDNQSITTVTMNTNHIYTASVAPAIMTVNFETNCTISIGSLKTNILYENNITSLYKEGYVFDGWTTYSLIGDDAIDTTVPKIEFPYEVTINNITLYATWRRLGLEYITYRNVSTGNTGYKITSYEKNDTELVIPSVYNGLNIIAIDADAFKNATKLEKLSLPATLEEIGEGFVRNCARLKEIELAVGSRYFSVSDDILYNFSQDEIIAYPAGKISAGLTLGGVKTVKNYAFYNAIVGGIEFAATISKIGDYAFYSAHIDYADFSAVNPTDLKIGENVFNENISHLVLSSAFEYAYNNKEELAAYRSSFTYNSADIPFIAANDSNTLLYKEIVNNNSDKSGTSVEIIGVDRTMKELILPITLGDYDVSSIGTKAFNGCIYLTSFIIPSESRLERILDDAFEGTPYIETLSNSSIIANGILYKYLGNDATYVLDRNITKIAERAFYNNKTLTRLDLRENTKLRDIGPFAFYGCTSLSGTVDDTDKGFYVKKDMERIANYAFAYSGITAFGIQTTNNLAIIGKEAFAYCYYLEYAAIGSQTTDISIDPSAFLFCTALQEFTVDGDNSYFVAIDGVLYCSTLPNGVVNTLFMYPAGKMVAEYDINNEVERYKAKYSDKEFNITTIHEYAFFMSNIAAVALPESVINISSSAFHVPGLVYVKFAQLNNGITFDDVFVRNTTEYDKYLPEYIVAEADDRNIDVFFGNNFLNKETYYKEEVCTEFVTTPNGELILKINVRGVNKYASVIKSSRLLTEIVIDANVEIAGETVSITEISEYAFIGHFLESLMLGEGISVLQNNSLRLAAHLYKLYLSTNLSIPDISEDTFNEKFDNGLFIYSPQINIELLKSVWGLSSNKYIIDIASGQPTAVFDYNPNEEPLSGPGLNDALTGVITSEWVNANIPVRNGYIFVGWCDDNDNLIDFTEPYVIPYNMKLMCRWETAAFKIKFKIEDRAALEGDSEVIVHYEEVYTFVSPYYKDGSKSFVGWKMSNGIEIGSTGMWLLYDMGSEIELYAVWEIRRFTLTYDVDINGVTECNEVYFDRDYVLAIPQKAGYTFIGWALDPDGENMLTDAKGESLLSWQYVEEDRYQIYSIWAPETVTVSLFFEKDNLFKTVSLTIGEDFYLPFENISDEQWAVKTNIFCGWYQEIYDEIGNLTYKRFTDENGYGLFAWDVKSSIELYAEWPVEISTGSELESLDDLNRSVILTSDIEVFAPIGNAENPFTGIFLGSGHTVSFNFTVDENTYSDGYIGLFAVNAGTIKDIKLDATITVTSTDRITSGKLYVGAIAGKNCGKIINSTYIGTDVSAKISVSVTTDAIAYIGGYTGYNEGGTIQNISMNLQSLKVDVNGQQFNKDVHSEKIICGTVVGCIDAGTIGVDSDFSGSDINETFAYYYTDSNDPFIDTVCGLYKSEGKITVAVSASQK